MTFSPVTLLKGDQTQVARNAAEYFQLTWDGWKPLPTMPPPPDGSAFTAKQRAELDAAIAQALSAETAAEAARDAAQAALAAAQAAQAQASQYASTAIQGVLNPQALSAWYAAAANRENAPANVCTIGDSIVEGAVASTNAKRWPRLLESGLRQVLPLASGLSGAGWIPMVTVDPVPKDERLVYNPSGINGALGKTYSGPGLGMKSLAIASGGTVTWSGQADRIKVYWSKGPLSGAGTITLDGVANSITGTTLAGAVASGQVWDSGAIAAGNHTVVITGQTGFGFVVDAIEVFYGDYGKGIRIYDAGHYMAQASWFTSGATGADGGHWAEYGVIKPSLTTIMLGVNDWGNGIAPATYLANIDYMLSKIATAQGTNPYSVLLMIPYKVPYSSGVSQADWDTYVAGLKARATGKVAVLDLGQRWPTLVANGGTATGVMSENVTPTHPNDSGQKLMAQILLDVLTTGNQATLTPPAAGIPLATAQAKGDLLVASGASAVTRLANPGVTGKLLQTDTSTASGFSYADLPSIPGSVQAALFTTPQGYTPWVIPAGAKYLVIKVYGGAGGGGAGRRDAAATIRTGGGGGGPGAYSESVVAVANIPGSPSTLYVQVGAGGSGAPGQTANTTTGAGGNAGGQSAVALNATPSAGQYLAVAAGGNGGLGGGAGSGGLGGFAVTGLLGSGTGGQGSTTGGAGTSGGSGGLAGGGGGGGGGLTAANVFSGGGTGGVSQGRMIGSTTAGTTDGQAGSAGVTPAAFGPGSGGGGGSSSVAGPGGAGGNGGPGAGGGGGGASVNGQTSGGGGNGGNGAVLIEVVF